MGIPFSISFVGFCAQIKLKSLFYCILFFLSINIGAQNVVVESGVIVMGTGGSIITGYNLVNNGLVLNTDNEFIITGSEVVMSGASPAGFSKLTISENAGITINSTGNTVSEILLCNGTLNPNSNLTLLSKATGTAFVDGSGTGTITGSLTMQRYVPSAFGYKYISSPFQNSTISELADDINLAAAFPAVYKYDESRTGSGWVGYANPAGVMSPMMGYSVNLGTSAAPATIDITGVPNNGVVSLALYNRNNTYTKGFNLVGNPYPSPIDWDSETGWTKSNINNTVFYFNAGMLNQYTGTYSAYMNGISSDGVASNIIPAMQGFFVHVADGSYPVAATLAVNNDARISQPVSGFSKSTAPAERTLLRISAGYSDTPAAADPLVVYSDEKATFGYDESLDALKMFNTDANFTNFYSFSSNGLKLAINSVPFLADSVTPIRLGLKTEKAGEIVFRLTEKSGFYSDRPIEILDTQTGTSKVLTTGNDFRVTLPAGDYQNRFWLNFVSVITALPVVEETASSYFKAWTVKEVLCTEILILPGTRSLLTVTDVNGRHLYNKEITDKGYYEFTPGLTNGIYIVTLSTEKFRESRKIMVIN